MAITARIPPSRARTQQREEQAIRLRGIGLSYRAIGKQIGTSHTQARRLCERAFAESAKRTMKDTDALLGEELDRIDGLIRAGSAIMNAPTSTPMEKLRAASQILNCQHAKVRWLGLAPDGPRQAQRLTREEVTWAEVQRLDDAAIDAELLALGYARVAEDGGDEDGQHGAERVG